MENSPFLACYLSKSRLPISITGINDDQGLIGVTQKPIHDFLKFLNIFFLILIFHRWFGIELDEPKGRHDGTVQDVRYFAAPDDHGVFVTESKISKLNNNFPVPPKNSSSSNNNLLLSSEDGNVGDSNTFSMNYHTLEDSLEQNNTNISSENLVTSAVTNTTTPTTATASPNIPNTTSLSKPRPLRRSLSMQHRAAKVI